MRKVFFTKILAAVVILTISTASYAEILYSYVGNAFQSNTLTGATNITASFISQSLLGPSQNYSLSSPMFSNFTISDGINIIPVGGGTLLAGGDRWDQDSWVHTSQAGQIDTWFIVELLGAGRLFVSETFGLPAQCCTIGDPPFMSTINAHGSTDASIQSSQGFFSNSMPGNYAYNNLTPGVWSMKEVASIPEPSTYAMLLAGLGIIGFMARNKQCISLS